MKADRLEGCQNIDHDCLSSEDIPQPAACHQKKVDSHEVGSSESDYRTPQRAHGSRFSPRHRLSNTPSCAQARSWHQRADSGDKSWNFPELDNSLACF
jgi:hypothetical protein